VTQSSTLKANSIAKEGKESVIYLYLFSASLLQSSVSHDPSEITRI